MEIKVCAARDVTCQEWEALRTLYVQAFVMMSEKVSPCDLSLMGNNPERFWAGVFDCDKPRSNTKNYSFSMFKQGERIIAYGLYKYVKNDRYLYIHHFCGGS